MPRHTTLPVPPLSWVQLTDADVTAISFVNVGATTLRVIRGTTVQPTDVANAAPYGPDWREDAGRSLADLWPGLTGSRAWAFNTSIDTAGSVLVSHA